MLGTANVSGSALADKIDLFGWSGSTGTAKWGISTSTFYSDYAGDFVDWGTNTISTNAPNTYRTLTEDEWYYLLHYRTNAYDLSGVARIKLSDTEYANGLILLPDNYWTYLESVTFRSGFARDEGIEYYATYQTFNLAEWQQLESAGAVFLPASGRRCFGSSMYEVQKSGFYWSATKDGGEAYRLSFNSYRASADNSDSRDGGFAVRLVKDLE